MAIFRAQTQHTHHAYAKPINVGSGSDVTIAEVAKTISQTVGYAGQIEFDISKPDGAPRNWMYSSLLNALAGKPR